MPGELVERLLQPLGSIPVTARTSSGVSGFSARKSSASTMARTRSAGSFFAFWASLSKGSSFSPSCTSMLAASTSSRAGSPLASSAAWSAWSSARARQLGGPLTLALSPVGRGRWVRGLTRPVRVAVPAFLPDRAVARGVLILALVGPFTHR